jgi:ribose-phosphate pyrophosphokinase
MKTLNLVRPEHSDVKYKISKFPDGQQDIIIEGIPHFGSHDATLTIISRFNSWRDLELIVCAKKALDGLGVPKVALYIPYLLGARSDRKFVTGGNSYLVNVVAPVLNDLEFCHIEVLDVHSDVAAACIKNLIVKNNFNLVDFVYSKTANIHAIISPDAGAYKKVYDVAREFEIPNIITAMKHRDLESGKVTHTEISIPHGMNTFLIVDDICDGGRTFIELAKVIKEKVPESILILCVTHGIFSAGFEALHSSFDKIFCTNSYEDFGEEHGINQLKVI